MDPCVRAPFVVLCETYFAPCARSLPPPLEADRSTGRLAGFTPFRFRTVSLRSVPPSSPRGRPLHRASGSIWTDYVACACSSAGVLPRVPPPVALLAHTMWLPRSIDPCSRARSSSLSLRCSALRPPPPKLPPRRQPVPPFFCVRRQDGRSCTAAAARAGSRTSSQGVVAMLSRCSSLRSEGSPSLRCGLLLASSAVGSGRLSRESGQRDGRALLQTGRVGSRPSSQGRRTPQALSGRRVDLRCSCFSSPPPPFGRAARLSSCGSYLHAAARVVLPLGRIVPLPIRVRAKGVAPPLPWHPRTSKGCMILWLHPRPAARSRRGEQAGRARATAPSPRRVRPSAGSATVPRAAGLVADRVAIVTHVC